MTHAMDHWYRTLAAITLGVSGCVAPVAAVAADLQVRVDDGQRGIAHAVVSLHSTAAETALRPKQARMDQRDSQFAPHVLPVLTGSTVTFPNSDNIRHNVYSFSPAKRFELPLYSGQPARSVRFETPGVVTLGCNIHDWMVGYVVVLDTPYSAVTDAQGAVTLQAPSGDYTLQVWHPHLPAGAAPRRIPLTVPAAGGSRQISLSLAPPPVMPTRTPTDARLQALQDKLRNLKRAR